MRNTLRKIWRRLAARPSCRRLNELLFECSLHGLGILNYQSEEQSGEKHFVEHILPQYLSADRPVMVDVGANVGNYSRLLKSTFPQAAIWAFEPNPQTYASLLDEFDAHELVTVNQGLGSGESTLKFYDRQDRRGSSQHGSLYREVIEEIHEADSIEIEVSITTLDNYAAAHGIDSIQLLKIDTEGHELEVLKGATHLLKTGKIDLLHIEFNEMNVISRVFFRDIAKILPDYQPYRLLPQGAIPLDDTPLRTEIFAFQNVVFVHKKFSPNVGMRPAA